LASVGWGGGQWASMDVTRDNFEESLRELAAAIADPHFAFWRCAAFSPGALPTAPSWRL